MTGGSPLVLNALAFKQIERRILSASNPEQRNIFVAMRACAYARFSLVDLAKDEVTKLRAVNAQFSPQLTAWIIFCEGLIHHFEHLDTKKSLDRFKRAKAIASVIGDLNLSLSCTAWMANSEFINGDSVAAVKHLTELFSSNESIGPEALARAFLVLADLLSWAGHADDARSWYKEARHNAVLDGDLALQSLVMLNSALFRVSELTLLECSGAAVGDQEKNFVFMEVASIFNLDQGIGQPHLTFLIPMMKAEVFLMAHDWNSAISLISNNISAMESSSLARLSPRYIAQMAYAKAVIRDRQGAMTDCLRAEESQFMHADIDDRAVYHSRLAQAYNLIDKSTQAADHSLKFQNCMTEIRHVRVSLFSSMRDVIELGERHKRKSPA